MKKFIDTPVVKVVRFEAKDVITTSCTIQNGDKIGTGKLEIGETPVQLGENVHRVAESKGFGGGINFSSAW